ncbi:hypothetical protein CIK05_13930 [Bdellovibrio sp. qaytius]|nr:hypothetical protein CIK05_13930 [Bdellovibrio sp. qaytius]
MAAGMMAIVMSAVASMMSSQQKETRAITEKLAQLDLQKLLLAALANGSICNAELAGLTFNPTGARTIDTTNITAQTIELSSLHASGASGAPNLIAVGETASPNAPQLKVSKIIFENFVSTGVPDTYIVDLNISFAGGVRETRPINFKMHIMVDPTAPAGARPIKSCLESGATGQSYRFVFTTTQDWVVPANVKSGFVTMAGGGGSGAGWRISNMLAAGHSGGYVFSHPVNFVPGEKITVTVGKGGVGFTPYKTNTLAAPGPPYYVYNSPAGDDGLGGYPGTSSKLVSPSMGTLLECAGGSGATIGGVDSFAGTGVAGNVSGATTGSGNPPFSAPNRSAVGPYSTVSGPGACGPSNYGIGNAGINIFSTDSGTYLGGTTPFGYGSGGNVGRSGCYITTTTIGTCTYPANGRDGVVFIDVY